MGQLDEAEEAFRQVVIDQPRDERGLLELATTRWMTRKYPEAEKVVRELIRVHPTNQNARELLIKILWSANQPDAVTLTIQQIEEDFPTETAWLQRLRKIR
jgi:cytochrome c-type biogenesis protein CcmH/NrfG